MTLTDYVSDRTFYDVELLSSAEELPRDRELVTSILDEETMERYEVYKDGYGLLWAIKE